MTWGVLLMAYGTASGPEDVERYYTHIRHGRPPTQGQLQDLLNRYEAIGGASPLFAITQAQGQALQTELDTRHGPGQFQVALGMKHSPPFIAQAVQNLAAVGIDRAVALVLAPHYSKMSVGTYLDEAQAALRELRTPMRLNVIRSWADAPGLIELLHRRIAEVRHRFSAAEQQNLPIIFSAHSLPSRILSDQDPYPHELRITGDLVAQSLGTTHYTFAWQSAGRTAESWMGPDILEKLTLMKRDGFSQAIICPCGFVSDHLEVLYDLDIQAHQHALSLGMHVERTRSLNDDPGFIRFLADLVELRTQ
ncbi:MAG: ferrochelatase [Sulfobacillus acidophilus]|uniref:Coproporphyrin III ferrochelatase n=1 Tax=Sulfobacillus acidophilus TaxID=53633 RepID=A0A2T2WEJ3_9FIRM|nr:MAG: ferrochelatase [Sulfobacillus acidophilus]